MDPFLQDDVIDFAEYLGMKGIDADVFYESYYNLDNDEVDRYYDETSGEYHE